MENQIQLYNYQQAVTDEIRNLIGQGIKHILIQLPTGGGKTVIFSYIAQNAALKENNVLIITDREELLSQAGSTIRKFDINCSYIRAGAKYIDRRKNIFSCFIAAIIHNNELNVLVSLIQHAINGLL